MYPEVCNFSWMYTLLYPGIVHWSVSPLCVNVCVRKCLHGEVNVCEDVCCCICYEIMWICLCLFLQ